ncbi:MAG: SoxR reducing system RseC family protein [Xanthomonadales bacterium]|nr:SoxR reducing system RseC family protein [Xanthomonadales bacterium]
MNRPDSAAAAANPSVHLSGCGQPGCCQRSEQNTNTPDLDLARDLRLGYGLPLVAMLLASALVAGLGHGDAMVALAAVTGLAAGGWLAGRRRAVLRAADIQLSKARLPAAPAGAVDDVLTPG